MTTDTPPTHTTLYHWSNADLRPGTVLRQREPGVPFCARRLISRTPVAWLAATPEHARAWGSILGKGAGHVYAVEVPADADCIHVQGCVVDLDPWHCVMPLRADEAAWWHATGLWMDPGWDPHFAEIITSARVTVLHRVNETETETL